MATSSPQSSTAFADPAKLLRRLSNQTQAGRYALLLREGNQRVFTRIVAQPTSTGKSGFTGIG